MFLLYLYISQIGKSEKWKYKTLSVVRKVETVKKLDLGEKFSDLASFYGIGWAIIYDIKKSG